MKLKKILASLTAAAMAMTVMAFTPITASADNYEKTYNGTLDEYGLRNFDLDIDIGTLSENAVLTINYDCTNATSAWPAVLTQFNAGAETSYGFVVDTHSFPENTNDTGSYDMNLSSLISNFKTEYPSIPTSQISQIRLAFWNGADASTIKITDKEISSIESIEIEGSFDEYGLLNFDLSTDLGSYPEDTKIKVYYDCTKATSAWPAVLTQFNAGAETSYGFVVDTHSFPENTNDTGSYEMNLSSLISNFKAEYPSIPTSQISQIRLAFWNGASATKIELLVPATDEPSPSESAISLSPKTLNLKAGETDTIKATVTPNDSTITWTSSDETVATVKDGTVTAVKAGTATITAKISDTVKDTCTVTVSADEPAGSDVTDVTVDQPANTNITVDSSAVLDSVTLSEADIAAGAKIVLDVKNDVSASDVNTITGTISGEQRVELILDITLNMVKNGETTAIQPDNGKYIPITIEIPNYDSSRNYFIIRIHNGSVGRIDGTIIDGKLSILADGFCPYALASEPIVNNTTVTSNKIILGSNHVYTDVSNAVPGTSVRVFTDFGFDANVYSGNKLIASLRSGSTFTMPASDVRIFAVVNGDAGLILNAKPVSYIFAYDADMNKITTASTRKSKVDGQITVKLGSEYAGKTVTLYSGRKNTSEKITSAEADKNGNVTFTVELGENYTAVVE